MRKMFFILVAMFAMVSCGNKDVAVEVATEIVPAAATEVLPAALPGDVEGGKVATEVVAD